MILGFLLRNTQNLLYHTLKHCATRLNVLRCMFLLKVFELLWVDNSIPFSEFQIELENVN